jgi:hypothetical protein
MRLPSFRIIAWAFVVGEGLHNLEEWLTLRAFLPRAQAMLARFGPGFAEPPWPVLQVGFVLVAVAPAVLVALATTGRRSGVKDWLVCWCAATYLANVFLPHIPLTIMAGGYTPGVVTAVLLNLPICSALLVQAVREGRLGRGEALAALGAGFATMPVVLPVVFAVAGTVARAAGAG